MAESIRESIEKAYDKHAGQELVDAVNQIAKDYWAVEDTRVGKAFMRSMDIMRDPGPARPILPIRGPCPLP